MLFPEIRQALKRWLSDSEPIALNLKNLTFNTVDVPDGRWLISNGYFGTAAALGAGMPAWSGESVSIDKALQHSVVWACNRIISESIGIMPAVLMQETAQGKRVAIEHPAYRLMKYEPNDEISSKSFRETLTSHCLLSGNGYAKIIRRSGTGTAIGMDPLLPEQVRPDREKTGQKRLVYVVKNETGAADKTYTVEPGKPHDIFHLRGLGWNGVRGFDVISYGRNTIGSALAQEKNVALFWANGGRVPGHIEWEKRFQKTDDHKNFANDFREIWADPHKAVVLDDGKKLVKDGLSMIDSQSVDGRVFTVSDICRFFSVFPPLVQDLSRATFSNIEHLFLYFEKLTLANWYVRWEQDFRRCVLTPEEKNQNFYLKHNANALLRADFQTRMTGYSQALQNGHMSIDEVRDLEDRNPLPDGAGEGYHIQLNMGSVGKDGQVQAPQGLVRLGKSS